MNVDIKSESPQTFQLTHSVSLLLKMHILRETEKKKIQEINCFSYDLSGIQA